MKKQLVATGDAPRLKRKENIAEDWKMKAEISFVQDDGMDDAKEAIETNREDVVRQDFAHISSKAENKELDLLTEKPLGTKGEDDDAEEEAEAEVGTSAEQEKSPTDNTDNAEGLDTVEGNVTGKDDQGQASIFRHARDQRDKEKKAIDKTDEEDVMLMKQKIRKTGRKMMRMRHKFF